LICATAVSASRSAGPWSEAQSQVARSIAHREGSIV
jgi:hypothetical protein